ncbi:serine, glycine and glutamine-rich protein-like [Paramacrobiotus metropolitanus]|uniref:serine, glycine and glutamine-rich protein-like n=1 Tax=Paramacrobiotus metropolitanus TaxID=2943436 RepID=UPI0024457624|nr:serine, glycine and glutamine-rich protein-like [Paramacrobiotus metropolitanus]
MQYLLWTVCVLCVAVSEIRGGSLRSERSSGSSSSSASSNNGQGVMSVSTSNSGGGSSSANALIGAGPGSGGAIGSMQSSVSNPTRTLSANSGPVVLSAGQNAGLGVSSGDVGGLSSPIDAGGIIGNGMQSPQQMLCALRQNICEQCLKINQLQRVIARNSGTSNTFTEMSCPGFCGTC